jgi:membrane fusion protein (multidrug efflux system)
MSKRVGSLIILALVLLFGVAGYRYLRYRSANAVSDAAFIKSDRLVLLSFKVGGKMTVMLKEENDPVKKGELLARIDPKDFEVTKGRVLHGIAALEEALEALKLKRERLAKTLEIREKISGVDIEALDRRIGALSYRIDAAARRLEKLERDTQRYRRMLEDRLIASGDYETVATERDALRDDIEGMKKERQALQSEKKKGMEAYRIARLDRRQIKELDKSIAAKSRELEAQRKNLAAVENKIAYTRLSAPFDGVIAKKFTDAPRVVESGSPVYALTDPSALYCEVLLSEKKLHGVKPGNEVAIEVEALKGKEYRGVVESIAPTSASTFSLVPRDIASGEFTKLDQRFVVRIRLESIEGLRAGMGASVAIERRGH